jgi:hypothetical protein
MAGRLTAFASIAAAALGALGFGGLANSATKQIDISGCVNTQFTAGQPVGKSAGNSGTALSAVRFKLLDPSAGNNVWLGSAGGSADIRLSVTGASAVDALINTYYGQSGISNATVVLRGTGGARNAFSLVGNTTIRDFNNWTWTNTINGTKRAQEWWTNNLDPKPIDGTHRLDVHRFVLGPSFDGQTLTHITIHAPPTAAVNFMEPLLIAVNVIYSGESGAATCVKSP